MNSLAHAHVVGSDQVVAEFGEWPSFHDAEVLRFVLERPESPSARESTAWLRVHVRRYETRGLGTVDYHQALVKSVVIDFRFTGVEELSVSEFNHQNVIDDIAFSTAGESAGISVEVPGIFGFDAQWKCREVEVMAVSQGPSAT